MATLLRLERACSVVPASIVLSIVASAQVSLTSGAAQTHGSASFMPGARRGGEVRIVAPSGGDFTTIQAAVNASAPGDTVLVKTGNYATFTIDGKGINVVADTGANVQVHANYWLVQNVPAGQVAAITGIELGRFRVLNNAGAIRIDGCVGMGQNAFAEFAGCHVVGTADLAVTRTTLWGDEGLSTLDVPGGAGLWMASSAVTLYQTLCVGGPGDDAVNPDEFWGTNGGDGMRTTGASSFVFAAGCQFVGGEGGDDGHCNGFSFAGGGGHGVRTVGSVGTSVGLENSMTGGAGGAGCPPGPAGSDGTFTTTIFESWRVLQLATPVRDNSIVPISFVGQPGDVVSLFISRSTTRVYEPDMRGVRMVEGPYSAILYMGIIPPGGLLEQTLRLDDRWTPQNTATLFSAQAVFAEPGGDVVLSNPVPLVVLDSVY